MFRVYWTLNYHLCMQVSTTHEVSYVYSIWSNSPGPLMDWMCKYFMDDSSVNFQTMFFFIFCNFFQKMKKNPVMEIYR